MASISIRQRVIVGKQYPHFSALAHAARKRPSFIAETPEEVGAHRAANRAAGVLSEHQAVERLARIREGRGKEYRRAERNVARVDCDTAARGKRNPQCAERSRRVGGHLAEEHIT